MLGVLRLACEMCGVQLILARCLTRTRLMRVMGMINMSWSPSAAHIAATQLSPQSFFYLQSPAESL